MIITPSIPRGLVPFFGSAYDLQPNRAAWEAAHVIGGVVFAGQHDPDNILTMGDVFARDGTSYSGYANPLGYRPNSFTTSPGGAGHKGSCIVEANNPNPAYHGGGTLVLFREHEKNPSTATMALGHTSSYGKISWAPASSVVFTTSGGPTVAPTISGAGRADKKIHSFAVWCNDNGGGTYTSSIHAAIDGVDYGYTTHGGAYKWSQRFGFGAYYFEGGYSSDIEVLAMFTLGGIQLGQAAQGQDQPGIMAVAADPWQLVESRVSHEWFPWPASGGGPALQTISPAGIASLEAFGSLQLNPGSVAVQPSGIGSAEGFGSPVLLPGSVVLLPPGIASAEALGDPSLLAGAVTLSPSAIASGEAFGSPVLVTGTLTIQPSGVASAEAVGTPALITGSTIVPTGIPSAEAFGTLTLTGGTITITPTGIASEEAFGTLALQAGTVVILPSSIASGEAFGDAVLVHGAAVILPEGIASAEAFGDATFAQGAALILPEGIASAEAFGSIVLIGGEQILGWLQAELGIAPTLLGKADTVPALLGDADVRPRKPTKH